MKKTLNHRAVAVAGILFLILVSGCRDATSNPENQELTKQRQAKAQEHKNQ